MVYVIFWLIIVGVVLYAINSFIPMDGTIKKILNLVVVLLVLLWLASVFGILDMAPPHPVRWHQ